MFNFSFLDFFRRLTVKSLRHQFLEHLGLEKLEAYQREVFKKTVHNIYAFYTNKNQGQSEGDQGEFDINILTYI